MRAVRTVTGVAEGGFERPENRTRDAEVPGRAVNVKDVSALGATPGYFQAWGMRLRQGRWFDASEFQGSA